MFTLEELTTPDGLIHQGLVARPSKPTTTAIVWIHGLSGTFYGSTQLLKTIANKAVEEGIVFASFNTRGHDGISGIKKSINVNEKEEFMYIDGGAGYEVFTDCIYDIQGVVDYVKKEGITSVFLAGHSTGANKVSYFVSEINEPMIKGVVLLSGVSDKLSPSINQQQLADDIIMMNDLNNSGKGLSLVVGKTFFPLTPKRFLSLFTPGPEDQFDYNEHSPTLPFFSNITKPVYVIIGDQDEYLDRPADQYLKVFRTLSKSCDYKESIIVGGNHGYKDKEQEVANGITEWILDVL